jgi:hypothetical protein
MSKRMISFSNVLFALMFGAMSPPAWGQDTAKQSLWIDASAKPGVQVGDLDEMLAEALRNNPDIRVAAAKVQEAEAELLKTRLEVIDKVKRHHSTLQEVRERLQTAERLFSAHAISHGDLAAAKLTAAQVEAEATYLLGKTKTVPAAANLPVIGVFDLSARPSSKASLAPQSPLLLNDDETKLANALNERVNIDFDDGPLAEALAYLQERYHIPVSLDVAGADGRKRKVKVTHAVGIPLGALFQLLTDVNPGLVFVVRDYGILAADANSVPPGAQTVREFWLAHQAKK